jgi:leader peptidase (prepilin peptidase)/N-methyltransferase
METALTIVFALLGLAVGSFLNVCIDRLPAGKSLVRPPSYCDSCQRRLSPRDLVPVFSYLWLRGRCRHCQARIPRRVLWVEIGTGLLFAFLYWYLGLTAWFAVAALYSSIFIVIAVIDIEHELILNKVVYPASAVALIISIFLPARNTMSLPWPEQVSGIIAGAIGFLLLLIIALIFRGGMGFGDVKMAALIGLTTGFPGVFVALFGGIVLGGLAAIFLLLLKIKKRKEPIPFGPFLSLATVVTLLYGTELLNLYLGMF